MSGLWWLDVLKKKKHMYAEEWLDQVFVFVLFCFLTQMSYTNLHVNILCDIGLGRGGGTRGGGLIEEVNFPIFHSLAQNLIYFFQQFRLFFPIWFIDWLIDFFLGGVT